MISLKLDFSLKDLLHEEDLTDFIYSGVTNDGTAIVYKRNDSIITYYQISHYPPMFRQLYQTNYDPGVADVTLSQDKRFLSYQINNNAQIVDTKPQPGIIPESSVVILENVTQCLPLFESMYGFLRNKALFVVGLAITKEFPITLLGSPLKLDKNVTWWNFDTKTHHIALISTSSRKKLYIYKLKDAIHNKWDCVVDYQLNQNNEDFFPTHFFVYENEHNTCSFILASFSHPAAKVLVLPSQSSCSIPFPPNFKLFPDISVAMNNSLIIVSAPKSLLFLFDVESHELFYDQVLVPELLDYEYPGLLVSCSLNKNVFYCVESLAFYSLGINWDKIILLLDIYDVESWKLAGHLIGGHLPFNKNDDNIIKYAASRDYPIGFYYFCIEYFIAKIYSSMKEVTPESFLAYLPNRPSSFDISDFSLEDKVRECICSQNDFNVKYNLLSRELDSKLIKNADKEFSPNGLWKQSTILYLLIYSLGNKQPKNKFPYPLSIINAPTINSRTLTSDERKKLGSLTTYQMAQFVTNFIARQEEISTLFTQSISSEEESVSYLVALLTQFSAARDMHFPFSRKCVKKLQRLMVKHQTSTMIYQVAHIGVFQYFDKPFISDFMLNYQLWMRSPHRTTENPPKFLTSATELNVDPNTIDHGNIFQPYVQFKEKVMEDESSPYRNIVFNDDLYSIDNLMSVYNK